MLKAGITALVLVISLILTAHQTNAQTPKKLGLLSATEKSDICSSPLRPYVVTYSNGCPIIEVRQGQSFVSIKEAKADEFSIAHAVGAASYTPTPTSQITATPTIQPTAVAQNTAMPTQTQPEPSRTENTEQVKHTDNNSDVILELINQHRARIGKAPFQKNEALCSLAKVRSTELSSEIQRGTLHSGLYNRNTSYRVVENAKVGGDENETVRWWLNSYVHRSAIESDYVYSCGGCTGKNCAQLFTNYDPKNHTATASSK